MRDTTGRVFVWIWILIIIVIVALSSSCRGGRSLGKGSAGTVIVPQTPQEINERNRQPLPKIALPPLEPLPPVAIIPKSPTPPATPAKAVRSTPTPPESKPVEANPVVVNPKSAGESKPFTPTTSKNAPPVRINVVKLPPNNSKGTNWCGTPSPQIVLDPRESDGTFNEETKLFNWVELFFHYLFFILIAAFIWTIYDIVKTKRNSAKIRHENGVKKAAKKKRKPTTRKKK